VSESPRLSAPSAPVAEEARLAPLDVLRGVAVLGILYMNIQNFSMIDAAYSNPTAYGDLHGANFLIWLSGSLFFHGKFIATFSMLFGAGIVLLHERLVATGRPALIIHLRRNVALLLIGLAHAHLLWAGDILFHYAAAGILLYPFQRMRPRKLALLAVLFILIGFGMELRSSLIVPEPINEPGTVNRFALNPPSWWVSEELRMIRGSWTEAQELRHFDSFVQQRYGFIESIFWWCGGLMLIGMALYKWGFFSAHAPARVYLACAILAALCLPAVAWEIWRNFHLGWDSKAVEESHNLINELTSIPMALGIASLVMLWCQLRIFAGTAAPRTDRAVFGLSLYDRLAAAGRMALTNYLMQTVLCTTLFYGHGFGLYGYVDRSGQFFITLAIWALQLFWSPLWLRYFRFGPVEWLWRSATYLRPQPMLR